MHNVAFPEHLPARRHHITRTTAGKHGDARDAFAGEIHAVYLPDRFLVLLCLRNNPPHFVANIISDQQPTVPVHRNTDGPAQCFATVIHETRQYIARPVRQPHPFRKATKITL